MKQPTTQQRFDQIIDAVNQMSANAGLNAEISNISKNSTINGLLECINHLKAVHRSGGDAGKFLNELETLCVDEIATQFKEAIERMKQNAKDITDKITKKTVNPEEN